MGRTFIFLGNFFRSVQGWTLMIFTILPAIWTIVAGYLDDLNWSARTVFVMVVGLVGLVITYFIVRLWETSSNFFESRREQKRIAKDLSSYIESGIGEYIDLQTAAVIWSGSRAEESAKRHLCFRLLKGHTNNGRIRNPKNLAANGKAFIGTSVPLDELVKFFTKQNVIKETDMTISPGT
jgi:hypothetical protein